MAAPRQKTVGAAVTLDGVLVADFALLHHLDTG